MIKRFDHLTIVVRDVDRSKVGNLLLDGLTRLEERFDRGGEFRPSLDQLHGAHEEHLFVLARPMTRPRFLSSPRIWFSRSR